MSSSSTALRCSSCCLALTAPRPRCAPRCGHGSTSTVGSTPRPVAPGYASRPESRTGRFDAYLVGHDYRDLMLAGPAVTAAVRAGSARGRRRTDRRRRRDGSRRGRPTGTYARCSAGPTRRRDRTARRIPARTGTHARAAVGTRPDHDGSPHGQTSPRDDRVRPADPARPAAPRETSPWASAARNPGRHGRHRSRRTRRHLDRVRRGRRRRHRGARHRLPSSQRAR